MNCHAWEDKHWDVVSYPYYAKLRAAGSQVFYKRLDLNVPSPVTAGAVDLWSFLVDGAPNCEWALSDDDTKTAHDPGLQGRCHHVIWSC